jgi:predicted amidohydrolase
MSDRLRVACVQLNSTDSKAENIERAEGLVARAAATGADLIVLPEKWTGIGPPEMMRGLAESLENGETVEAMSGWARTHGVTLVGGSIVERREGREKLSNTCVVFDPQGEIQAVYRKIHMFDVEVGGQVYRESETEESGEATVTTEVEGWKLGLTVCYDLRFPELYRVLAVEGARILTVPAAFTLTTTRDHWEPLVRARAIENQAFVIAANQIGEHPPNHRSGGRSLIVDPWGIVLAAAPDAECVITADLDLEAQAAIRRRLPSLANRRPTAYHRAAAVGA